MNAPLAGKTALITGDTAALAGQEPPRSPA